jgi:hypothetical protein
MKMVVSRLIRRYPRLCFSAYEHFIFFGRVNIPSAKPSFLEDQFVSLGLAEMRFLRSVKGYTRLDKIRSEIMRRELENLGIEGVRTKQNQNWMNNLERTDNNGLPKHALKYKPRGRRDRGRPRKRWQHVDAGTGQNT